jgi:glycosyltransferase involved in cell wall biosynthesis
MGRVINILHLKTSAGTGGAEILLTYWPRYMDKVKFNQSAIFADNGPLVRNMQELGTKVECLTMLKTFKGFIQLSKLVSFLKQNRIDLIHAHGARVNFWGSFASLLTGVPIISTEHNIDLWRDNNYFLNSIDGLPARINKVRVGVSDAVCNMLKNKGVNQEKIVCIENGIDVERFNISVDIAAKRLEFGIRDGTKIIGTVGRLVEQKGHKYLLDAFKVMEDGFPDMKLLIVGDGPLMKTLKEQVSNLGLEGKVIFTGLRTDISELLAIMNIFVLPSITEGLPLVLLEAMAAGKPVVASAVSGIPYVIDDAVDGLLAGPTNFYELSEKMLMLIKNERLASELSQKAREKALSKYNAKGMIKKYENLYMNILENSKRDKNWQIKI